MCQNITEIHNIKNKHTLKNQNIKKIYFKNYIQKNTTEFYKTIISLFLAGFSTFSILYSIQPILPIFSRIFFLTPTESSLSLSIATASMACGMLFMSPISNRIGRKNVMSISLFCASFLTLICAFSTSWIEIIIIRSLIGISLSGVTSVAIIYLSEEVDLKILPLCIGLYISGNTIGGFLGRLISNIIVRCFSWRYVFIVVGSVSLFFTILFFLNLPQSKNFKKSMIDLNSCMKNFFIPFKIQSCIIFFIVGFLFMGSFVALFNYIGYRFIMKPFLFHPIYISCLSVIYLIGVYSSPKASFLSEKYGRMNVFLGALYLMIIGVILTYYNLIWLILFGLILFTTGFFIAHSTASSAISIMSKKNKLDVASLYFFFYYLGSSLFGSFVGIFWFYWGWNGVFLILNFVLILSVILINQIKDDI
ncbi:MFS transporter [Buchnera aphidicola]|uniref:MFS transporter n=1 Tax=Buchnera aphidicola TaxID=9 RepID=UPI0022385434|nr:MFS transporter [Buchnera aphidicola]MCW5197436.1 MFS transporter [Buchnera aphidicola (Chaitophorus viminalis)]